ncbi:uncharacterized protein AB675_8765 [Cyphellophora attinorum]|uniref:BZIP transcription factor n=1 Tax=Cyphellophora attinorum TaxID=1664694 RepID=A0A0N1HA23_9EURO|nr:uncharacterized protein AB675_8765 [Phialophora attinorum]KPI44677.1 hypothetical protein AB675_8765 [Phialophora attinorum]
MQPDLTQPSATSPNGSHHGESPEPASRKRKGMSTSSRGVASLTPDQLAKKRANDREAQRAIRERTKRTIETLETKIRELESQQPYQELQTVIRQKNAIEAENTEIRRRLGSIMALIQPILGAQGLTDLASAAHHNAQSGIGQTTFSTDAFMNGQRPYAPQDGQMPQGQANQYPAFGGEASNADNRQWNASRDALDTQRDNMQRGLELDESGEQRLSFNSLLDSLGQRAPSVPGQLQQAQHHSPDTRGGYPSINSFQDASPTLPQTPWTVLPKNCDPTCPLDNILLNFITTQRREIEQGGGSAASSNVSAPTYPSVASLLNPTGGHRVDRLSQLMTDVIDKFPNIANLPERVATLYFMFSLTRWMITPTQENYERIPEFFTPRPWIDHIPFPRMRDKLVATYKDHPFELFFMPFTSGMSVNWPYDPTDCLISTSEKEDPIINPVFERHIRRLENWSVAPILMEQYPDLQDTARVKAQAEHRKLD